ncbi:MAG: hypothetical protein MUF83_18730 [Acidimicrobiales bacterium]|nr:hypothetical protein [Acidimicrobiales bacterium]
MAEPQPRGPDPDGAERDWFGYPLPPSEGGARGPVACPLCGVPFTAADELAAHAASVHGLRRGSGRRPGVTGRLRRWWHALGFLPLWFVLPLDALLVALVVAVLWDVDPWVAAAAGALATFPLVLVLSHRTFSRRV